MPLPLIIPVVLSTSIPVTVTFMGATVYANLVQERREIQSHYWAYQCCKGRTWIEGSQEDNEKIDKVLEQVSSDDPVATIKLGTEECSIDFSKMEFVAADGSDLVIPRKILRKVNKRRSSGSEA